MGILDRFKRTTASNFEQVGIGGTEVYGGQVDRHDRNPSMQGANRWRTAQDIMTNVSIVAAGLRYSLNLTARPTWKVVPADNSDAAKADAEFMDSVIHGTDQSWSRLIRREAIYRYHGFGLHEWAAKRREDGRVGIASIRPRPPQTISEWDFDGNDVRGVWQRSRTSGEDIYLPRSKLIYFVDDSLTDSPEGLGWMRQLIEPRDRMKKFLALEKIGFERDLSGTPIGRAPYAAIQSAIKSGGITKAEGKALTKGIEEFVQLRSKEPDTGLMLDSQPFVTSADGGGKTVSNTMQYALDLLTGDAGSIEELGTAIERTTWDMALIMGVERLLVGKQGAGSLALSQDTSNNLFLTINATLGDMAEALDRDLIGPVWALNGKPAATRPTLSVEDASFKDVTDLAKMLADMAAAGAVLEPDDPAINELRSMAGLPAQPGVTPEGAGMVSPAVATDPDNPDAPEVA